MNKKHICIMTSVHPWYDTRVYHKEARAFAQAGHRVTMLCRDRNDTDDLGIEFRTVKLPKNRFIRMKTASKRFYAAAKEIGADIYIFHDPELLKLGERLAEEGIKAVYDSHEDVPRQILTKPYLTPWVAKKVSNFMEKREKRICAKLFSVVAAEPVIYKRMIEYNKNAIMVCNFPMLTEFAQPQENQSMRENMVCYLGAITNIRGIHEIIDAMDGLETTLILAGNYETQQLKHECEKMAGYKNVDYRGFLDRDSVVDVLKKSKAGLVTLHPIPKYKEALPVKMFEYMAAEVPVIASNFPYWKKIVDDANCGLTVNPLDPEEIRSAISYIIKNPDVAAEMGTNGRNAVLEKYNWEHERDKLLHLFDC